MAVITGELVRPEKNEAPGNGWYRGADVPPPGLPADPPLAGPSAGPLSRVATRSRRDGMVNPRGSTFRSDHSRWPMTLRADQPWARQRAAETRSIASSWAAGQGSAPSPRLTHSNP